MKILVAVKRTVDYNVKVQVKRDETGVETKNVKMSMNPFDEIALEEAVRLKEAGSAVEVVVVSVGPEQSRDVLRSALSVGADRGILIQTDDRLQPLAVARCLKAVVDRERPMLALLGKQAIDDDSNQTGQMLAALLGWSQGTFACRLRLAKGEVVVTREIDGGVQTIALKVPAVVTADLRLNTPRYASLPNIVKAKKKAIETIALADLGVDAAPRLTVLKVKNPPQRQAGSKVANAVELARRLKFDARVI